MEGKKTVTPISFDPDEARKEMEAKREAAERDKRARERMTLAIGCEEMTRIVNDILVPEFLDVVHMMLKANHRAEVVAYDAENPVYLGEMCDIGMKFRCGDRDAPCKIEFVADPNNFTFSLITRDPQGAEHSEVWSFASVIPRRLRQLIFDFLEQHFAEVGYQIEHNDFDQYDVGLKGPFKINIEEDGQASEVASTDTMEEAIKMGASFSKMFKGKPLHIVDKEGVIVC